MVLLETVNLLCSERVSLQEDFLVCWWPYPYFREHYFWGVNKVTGNFLLQLEDFLAFITF